MVYKIPGNKINSLTKLLVAEDLVGLLLQASEQGKENVSWLHGAITQTQSPLDASLGFVSLAISKLLVADGVLTTTLFLQTSSNICLQHQHTIVKVRHD